MRTSRLTARHSLAILLTLMVLVNLGTVDALVVCRSADGHVRIEWVGNPCGQPTHEDPSERERDACGANARAACLPELDACGASARAACLPELDACGSLCQDVPLAQTFLSSRAHVIQLHGPQAAAVPAGARATVPELDRLLSPHVPCYASPIPPCLGAAILLL